METFRTTLMTIFVCLIASSATASILGFKSLAIDFTNADDAKAKATWSEPNKLNVTTNGLGWDGETVACRDGWVQTTPLALGESWRPPGRISVRVSIHPRPSEFVLNNGQKLTCSGEVYVRYSPDLRHWSTWQVLETSEPQSYEKQNPGRHFSGTVCVPDAEREQYGKLISEYSRLDVPWKSDEDAAVRWILEKNPDFFNKELPFIGYVEFRYEAGFYGGQRITSFKADVSYGMSGMHLLPKDKDSDSYKNRFSKPWSFQAEKIEKDDESARRD